MIIFYTIPYALIVFVFLVLLGIASSILSIISIILSILFWIVVIVALVAIFYHLTGDEYKSVFFTVFILIGGLFVHAGIWTYQHRVLPDLSYSDVKVGERIEFGRRDNDGKQSRMTWRVIEIEGDAALIEGSIDKDSVFSNVEGERVFRLDEEKTINEDVASVKHTVLQNYSTVYVYRKGERKTISWEMYDVDGKYYYPGYYLWIYIGD